MNEPCYYQYAFAGLECRVRGIGPGVDPQYGVELIFEGPTAAVVSRVSLDLFAPERLLGRTAEDIQWLDRIAGRHKEIICQAAASSAVLPLRLGTVFESRECLQAKLVRCGPTVARYLKEVGNRQEWEVRLYLEKRRLEPAPRHSGLRTPHYFERKRDNGFAVGGKRPAGDGSWPEDTNPCSSATGGTMCLTRKKARREGRCEPQGSVHRTIERVEQYLAGKAEKFRRIGNLPSDRTEEMVFNAAYLLSPSTLAVWLEAVRNVDRDVYGKGLALETSGPWPPYHFCPILEL